MTPQRRNANYSGRMPPSVSKPFGSGELAAAERVQKPGEIGFGTEAEIAAGLHQGEDSGGSSLVNVLLANLIKDGLAKKPESA